MIAAIGACGSSRRARPSAAASLLAWLLVPCAAIAQSSAADPCPSPATTQTPCEEPSLASRAMDRYRALRLKGINPMLGSIVPGSSFSAGGEVRRERLLHMPIGAAFQTMWSIRGYHAYEVRVGRIRGDHHRAELRPLDADLTSAFNDDALIAPGLSLYADVRQRVYPRVDFFGLGQQSSVRERADFGIKGTSVDGVLQWQHNRHLGASVRIGMTRLSLERGTNHGVIDLKDRFPPEATPGRMDQPRYLAIGLAAILDYRDKALLTSSGSWMGVAWWKSAAADASETDFTRVVVDARHFIAVNTADHVLALRAILSSRIGDTEVATPFYLQPTLGGSKTLRGLGSYRLRGDAVWAATAEYRWHVQRWVEVAPFVDVGAVATRFSALHDVRPTATPGIGVRARTDERVVGRLDYAAGRDGQRVVFTLSAPF